MFGAWRFESSWTVGGLGARGITYLVCLIELHGLLVLGLPPFSACGSSISAGSCWLIEQGPFYSEIRIMRGYLLGTLFVLWLLVFLRVKCSIGPSPRPCNLQGRSMCLSAFWLIISQPAPPASRFTNHKGRLSKADYLEIHSSMPSLKFVWFYKPMVLYLARHHPFNQYLVFMHRQL